MAKLFLGEQGPQWRPINSAPFHGDVKIFVVPATQDELDVVNEKVDALEKAAKEDGLEFSRHEVWSREYFDHFLRNWKGVEDDLPCNRETKLKALRRSRVLVTAVTIEADYLAQVKVEAEQGNS